MTTTIDKIIPEGQIIHVFGSIDGVKIKTSGQAFPYTHAKSPAHAQRYLERLIVNAASQNVPMSEAGIGVGIDRVSGAIHLEPSGIEVDCFIGPVELQAFKDAYESVLDNFEKRIAKLEQPWWKRLFDYFGFNQPK